MASPPTKVSLYDLSALKSTADDALTPILTGLPAPYKFKQSHYFTNIRLALGYVAVTIAGVLFYADWKLGWKDTKPYTLPACVVYFILNSALTLWVWKFEAGKVFVGTREKGQTISLSSFTRKFDPTYNLTITSDTTSNTIKVPFSEIYNTYGFLDRDVFKQWLAGNIEVVGSADPAAKRQWHDRNKIEEADEEIISAEAARIMSTPDVRQRKGQKG